MKKTLQGVEIGLNTTEEREELGGGDVMLNGESKYGTGGGGTQGTQPWTKKKGDLVNNSPLSGSRVRGEKNVPGEGQEPKGKEKGKRRQKIGRKSMSVPLSLKTVYFSGELKKRQ